MLVLVSFVLVLAAAVTLVVGLLQSGLTLIYLSIACSVLAGIVLAVAVLRGRPEPRPAAAGRSFTPPARAPEPASVGAYPSAAETSTTSWSAPTSTSPPPPPPPPPSPPRPRPASSPPQDETTRASTALLGRLRGKRAQMEGGDATAETPAPEPVPVPAPAAADTAPASADETMEIPAMRGGDEADDGFPIADYDRLRATELLSRLPSLDRNQLEAVRQREASGKNRFTVMSRIDSLLAAQQDPAWQVDDDEWESGVGADAESEAVAIEAEAIQEEEDFATALDEQEDAGLVPAAGAVEDDEVDQMAAPADDFPIAGYESLTVGQILPRLSDLDADQLAQVRAREQAGRARGTILDRIDRLAAKSGTGAGALAMPAAGPTRKAPTRKAPARKAPVTPKAPAVEAPPAPEPAPAAKKARARKAAVPPPPVEAPVKKSRARKAAAPPAEAAIPVPPPETTPPPRKAPARARKATATPAPPVEAPVKKARATKAAPVKKASKRP